MSKRKAKKALENSEEPLLFEASWEVCNQVGGIYTVIRTKVPSILALWGENYFLLGPYQPQTAAIEFEEVSPGKHLAVIFEELKKCGVTAHFGRWLVPGKPKVILLDYRKRYSHLGNDKYFLWKDHGISTHDGDFEVNDVIAFGFSLFEFFRLISEHTKNQRIILHVHEWLAAVVIPRIKHLKLPIGTIFTTHATLLGRYMASDNPNFYNEIEHINPFQAAKHYNILPRHLIERVAAQTSDVFTTISEVTATEAKKFLGRKPDYILPNGLNVHRFAALHEFQNLHLKYKEKIHEFVMGHFFRSYQFDLDRTLYFIISGRYEYKNKGMDFFIEALASLNRKLKTLSDPPTVIGFIVTRGTSRNINVNALQNHLMFEDLKNVCLELESGIGQRLLMSVAKGHFPNYEELLPHDFQVRLKRAMYSMKTDRLPSIVTHDLVNDSSDPVLQHLRHRQLFNSPSDPVKVVFHPDFVTSTSPLFNLDYDQFVRGCHMGVFPSYYEPWGYTPVECLALGLPTITTDLSGFGTYVQRNIPDAKEHGVFVLNRTTKTPDESIAELADHLFKFTQLGRRERIELRYRAENLTQKFDWALLVSHYNEAYEHLRQR